MANDQDTIEEESIEGLELEVSGDSEGEQEDNTPTEDESQNSNESKEYIATDTKGMQRMIPRSKKMIMIVAGGFVGFIILIFLILYFVGVFDDEPEMPPVVPETKKEMQTPKEILPPIKKYAFKIKDINKKRLNRKLSLLTKEEIIEPLKKPEEEKIVLIKTTEIEIKEELPKKKKPEKIKKIDPKTVIIKEKIVYVKKPSLREIEKNKAKMLNNNQITPKDNNISNKKENNIPMIKNDTMSQENNSTQQIKEDTNISSKMPSNSNIIEESVDDMINTKEMGHKEATISETAVNDETMKEDEEELIDESSDFGKFNIEETYEDEEDEEIDAPVSTEIQSTPAIKEMVKETVIEDKKAKNFLMFTQVATIKQKLYFSYLNKINKIDKRISVCRNGTNDIQIFIGPFLDNEERKLSLVKIQENIAKDAFLVDFTEEEFDKRCKL